MSDEKQTAESVMTADSIYAEVKPIIDRARDAGFDVVFFTAKPEDHAEMVMMLRCGFNFAINVVAGMVSHWGPMLLVAAATAKAVRRADCPLHGVHDHGDECIDATKSTEVGS